MRFANPTSTEEAVKLLSEEAGLAKILAGGTDLLVQMKSGNIEPDLIVDIKKIPGIREIIPTNGGYKIGAAVSGSELSENEEITRFIPGVVEAFELIGSTQIQGRCTMVGNLCNASPAADTTPALFAVEAKVDIAGPSGIRNCPIEDIPVSPGKNSLKKGEFITSIFVPSRSKLSSDAYLRFTPRTEMDIAVVSAAVSLEIDVHKTCTKAKIALGAVAPTVITVEEASKHLIGTKLDEKSLKNMSDECIKACNPIDDKRGTVEYRTEVSGVLARRAAKIAYDRAGEKL
mgnify:CR=1 FL=1